MSGFGNRYISGIRWSLSGLYMESGYTDSISYPIEFQPKNEIFETTNTTGTDFKDTCLFANPVKFKQEDNKSHAVPGGKGDKRSLVYNSLFSTGLLRRAIQALFGRANPRFVVDNNENSSKYGEQSEINIITKAIANKFSYGIKSSFDGGTWLDKIIALQQTKDNSRGMFRDDNYNYFYISMEYGLIKAYPCVFGGAGKWIINYIKKHSNELSSEEINKLETYALSDINVYEEGEFTVGQIITKGLSIHNGWHFNGDGSKASIVTIESIFSNIGDPPMVRYLTTRLYTLSIQKSGENSLSASLSLVEEENCTPRNGTDNVWIPFYLEAKMIYYYWVDQRGFTEPLSEYDAPVYCMYDKDDTLLVARVYYKKLPLPDIMTLPYFQYNVLKICQFDYRLDATYENLTSYAESGLTVDNGDEYKKYDRIGSKFVGFTARYFTGAVNTYNVPYWDSVPWGLFSTDCGTVIKEWPNDGYDKILKRYGIHATSMYSSTSTWTVANNFCLVIPWYDAESFYCSSSAEEQSAYYRVDFDRYGFSKEYCYNNNGREMTRVISQNGLAELATGGGMRSDWTSVTTKPFEITIEIKLDLYYTNGILNCSGLDYYADYENTSEIIAVKGRWNALNDPILFGVSAYPYFDLPFIVNQGNSDNLVYFDNPNVAAWLDGFEQRNIISLDIEQPFTGIFSGWA